MIKEAIILAGGLGTRLREAVPDLPKCMAPVAGRPFLFHVINYLRLQGIERFIFSLGYKHEVIEEYLQGHFPTLKYVVALEEEPLGTGGAIQLACTRAESKHIVVVNGDTMYKADLHAAYQFHIHHMHKIKFSNKSVYTSMMLTSKVHAVDLRSYMLNGIVSPT